MMKLEDAIEYYEMQICGLGIIFKIEQDYIYIIAAAHQHRKLNYWLDCL